MSAKFIPYGRHVIDEQDIEEVVRVLRGDWLTTGPLVGEFEKAFAESVTAQYAVAVSNGTAALHLCMLAAGIGPGDEVIVPALTFAASANCVRYAGGTVVFADVRSDTLTVDPAHVEALITPRTKAIVTVDYAGLPSDLDEIMALAKRHGLIVVEDACHAVGAEYKSRRVGSIAHLSCFSFHPVKHLTTAEGGMVTSTDERLAARVRLLRNHGIGTDHRQREELGTWAYDMTELGYNYRLNDVQCALGLSQLRKLPQNVARRREIASAYQRDLSGLPLLLQAVPEGYRHAWHLYAVRLDVPDTSTARKDIFAGLRAAGIGVNVHYVPVYLHSYYRNLGYARGLCPIAERAYEGLLSLPMWHGMTDADQQRTVSVLSKLVEKYV